MAEELAKDIVACSKRPRRGVYFVSSDSVLDITVAFLKSFRLNNRFIPLCLIPFNDNYGQIAALSELYNFNIYDDTVKLARCDRISEAFFSTTRGHFRKLCTFDGPFDEFIYVDCDTVVLKDLYFIFQFLETYDFVFSNSDLAHTRRWVWKDSIVESDILTGRQVSFAANTGFFGSRRGAITIDEAEARLGAALKLAPHMELLCVEQPFLNYLVVVSGKRYTSLLTIRNEAAPYCNLPLEQWAGGDKNETFGREYRNESEDVLLIHWAGCWQPSPKDLIRNDLLRKEGRLEEVVTVSANMPRRSIWEYYRNVEFK